MDTNTHHKYITHIPYKLHMHTLLKDKYTYACQTNYKQIHTLNIHTAYDTRTLAQT